MCPEASPLKPGAVNHSLGPSCSCIIFSNAHGWGPEANIFYYHALRKMRPRDVTQFPKLTLAAGRRQSWRSSPGPSASSACLLSGTRRGSLGMWAVPCSAKTAGVGLQQWIKPHSPEPLILSEAKPGLQITPTPLIQPRQFLFCLSHVSASQLRVPLGEKCPVANYSLKTTRPLRFLWADSPWTLSSIPQRHDCFPPSAPLRQENYPTCLKAPWQIWGSGDIAGTIP